MSSTSRVIRLCRWTVLLVAMLAFYGGRARLGAAPFMNCSDACGGDSDCGTFCLDDYDNGTDCGDYDGGQGAGEGWGDDCGLTCDVNIDCSTQCLYGGSPTYCGSYGDGIDGGECYGTCGDGQCNAAYETCSSCPQDCSYECTPPNCVICDPANNSSDCSEGETCMEGGCCVAACFGPSCNATQSRTCDDTNEACSTNSDCCSGEACMSFADPVWTYTYFEW